MYKFETRSLNLNFQYMAQKTYTRVLQCSHANWGSLRLAPISQYSSRFAVHTVLESTQLPAMNMYLYKSGGFLSFTIIACSMHVNIFINQV